EIRAACGASGQIHRDQVRVPQSGGQGLLLTKPCDDLPVVCQAAVDHLDRHEALRAELPRLVDGGHAATAEHPEDLVARKGGRVLHSCTAARAVFGSRGDGGSEPRAAESVLGRQEGCHGGLPKVKNSLSSRLTCFWGQGNKGGRSQTLCRGPPSGNPEGGLCNETRFCVKMA